MNECSTKLGDLPVFKVIKEDLKKDKILRKCDNPKWEVSSRATVGTFEVEYFYQYKTMAGAILKYLKERSKSSKSLVTLSNIKED